MSEVKKQPYQKPEVSIENANLAMKTQPGVETTITNAGDVLQRKTGLRSEKEMKVLKKLAEAGVSVVTPFEREGEHTLIILDNGKKITTEFLKYGEQQKKHTLIELGKLIAKMHNTRITHCDLTPRNITIAKTGNITLNNFRNHEVIDLDINDENISIDERKLIIEKYTFDIYDLMINFPFSSDQRRLIIDHYLQEINIQNTELKNYLIELTNDLMKI